MTTGTLKTAQQDRTEAPTGRSRRRTVVASAAGVTLIVVLVLVAVWRPGPGAEATVTSGQAAAPSTATVTLGSLVDRTAVRGRLGYGGDTTVDAGVAGVLTSLPAVGTTIRPGGTLYTVNTRPVMLLAGTLPAWRDLRIGAPDGQDVRQLEQNLHDLGFLRDAPDARFTTSTAAAVRSWQTSLGLQATGVLQRAAILFADQPLRVASTKGRPGADVTPGTELYTATGTDTVVTADIDVDDVGLAARGAAVAVVLPDGSRLRATIASVGEAVQRPSTDGSSGSSAGKVVVPVTITPDGRSTFTQADVTVELTSRLGRDLLTVPVEALMAIDATTFAVEVPDAAAVGRTTVLPVKVGAFASGRVAISGDGIAKGVRVVVAGP